MINIRDWYNNRCAEKSERQRKEKQYRQDLIELSGGLPRKKDGSAERFAFYVVLFMNAVSYNEEEAGRKAESSRRMRREFVESH